MKCVICHSETIEKQTVEEEIHHNNNIVILPVSVLVCTSCGERYYDRKTVQHLETVREEIRNNRIQLKETGKILTVAS